MTNTIYKTAAVVTGGREGKGQLNDNTTSFSFVLPKELGGPGSDKGLNPEQLFAVAYATCFEGAINFVSNEKKLGIKPLNVTAVVELLKREGGFSLAVNLSPRFAQSDLAKTDKKTIEDLVIAADLVCPYSHAVRGNIQVKINTVIE